ncbi:HD-GYP domain-containing protein [Acidaminobacter sp. JC074]|uniref:HD-GYP domain-containing protein n=1 Tax=Acidaminobacter sp. JC074 TaxID=2530199 RepID=UPI001F1098AD|nr:HD-GYP domain-containing protein [Acidaminobacter sp. JC074]MCH4890923.1 HD-GYP domain-containing protein [Acidaminobacter sp. JC074]
MRRLLLHEVEQGMVIGEDIYNNFDVMVVASGSVINESIMDLLDKMDVFDVAIYEKSIEGKKKVLKVDNTVQATYKDTVTSFKNLFNNVKFGKQVVADEISDLLTPMLEQVKNNQILAKSLWQIEACDEYTYDHSVTVSMSAALLGKWLNLPQDTINDLATAGLLHDIGKCNIPDEILKKPDRLTEEEFKVMKTHSTLGYLLLKNGKGFSDEILYGVYQHHEKFDGNGYPNRLREDEIHQFGRIIAVADVYSAMTSNRVYRSKMSPFQVARLIMEYSFGYLDPVAVNVFLSNISNFYVGTTVKLNNGTIGEVVMVNKAEPYRPLVKVDDAFVDLAKDHSLEITALID